jgi:hypothetical protein
MRRPAFLFALVLVAGCNRGDDAPLRRPDGSLLSDAGGEVSLSDGSRLKFVITSDRYKQWDAARQGLSKDVVSRYGQLLKPKSPTQQSIDRATAFLESNPRARQSIESSGMSVKDFVLMTVALEQEMQLASARGESPPEVASVDTSAYALPTVPPPYASTYPPPPAYTPSPTYPPPVYPSPIPTPPYDTSAYRDTTVRPLPVPRLDTTYRRDTLVTPIELPRPAPRDSITPPPRDTAPSPPRQDSLQSPDALRRR